MNDRSLRIYSWNVNGIRACARKGFGQWLSAAGADMVGLQETRATTDQVPPELLAPDGYEAHYVAAERAGYSGVGLLCRRCPDGIETSLGDTAIDAEGRVQIAKLGALTVANIYFPNGNGKDRDNGRVPFKLEFYRALLERLSPALRAGERVLVMGDFNTAHHPIDLARPKQNLKTSGFLPVEREALDRYMEAGFVDTFRHFEPGPEHYSWWSQRFGVREKNIGWRIDYVLASEAAMPFVRRAHIARDVMGSDHCPVGVDLDPAILERP